MLNLNGKFLDPVNAVVRSGDHSYRYGDGLFETMKVVDGHITLKEYHFQRLFEGLKILKFSVPSSFTEQTIASEVRELCNMNGCPGLARARLSVSRGSGGLYDCDNRLGYLIECHPLQQHVSNAEGLVIDVFPDARKTVDIFSNLKSANYLPYVMAAVWAKENHLDDALILNYKGSICEATSSNVFWVKDEMIFTPPLREGCVAGVMRRRVIELHAAVYEAVLEEDILLAADELFLTNVTTGLRWVKQFRNKTYGNTVANKLFGLIDQTK